MGAGCQGPDAGGSGSEATGSAMVPVAITGDGSGKGIGSGSGSGSGGGGCGSGFGPGSGGLARGCSPVGSSAWGNRGEWPTGQRRMAETPEPGAGGRVGRAGLGLEARPAIS